MNTIIHSSSGPLSGIQSFFSPKATVIGVLAIFLFWGGSQIIGLFSDEPYLISRSSHFLASQMGPTGAAGFEWLYQHIPGGDAPLTILRQHPQNIAMICTALWFLFLFSFFGGAICRRMAVRLGKYEAVSIKKCLQFAWRHKMGLWLSPLVWIIVAVCLYLINMLVGYIGEAIPILGPILFLVGLIFAIASTAAIIIAVLAIFLGLPLMPAAIGADGSDWMETNIGIVNYLMTHSWSYILYYSLSVVYVISLLIIGNVFLDLVFYSTIGVNQTPVAIYHIDKRWETVKVQYANQDTVSVYYQGQEFDKQKEIYLGKLKNATEAEKNELLQHEPQAYQVGFAEIWAYLQKTPVEGWWYDSQANETILQEHPMSLTILWRWNKFWTCVAAAIGFVYWLLKILIWGHVLALGLAASTSMYLTLRKEVDSTDISEIWDEDAEYEIASSLQSSAQKRLDAAKNQPASAASSAATSSSAPNAGNLATESKDAPGIVRVSPATVLSAKVIPPTDIAATAKVTIIPLSDAVISQGKISVASPASTDTTPHDTGSKEATTKTTGTPAGELPALADSMEMPVDTLITSGQTISLPIIDAVTSTTPEGTPQPTGSATPTPSDAGEESQEEPEETAEPVPEQPGEESEQATVPSNDIALIGSATTTDNPESTSMADAQEMPVEQTPSESIPEAQLVTEPAQDQSPKTSENVVSTPPPPTDPLNIVRHESGTMSIRLIPRATRKEKKTDDKKQYLD